MSEKPKRRWFRFHLLTAVLMMVAAGGFSWANTIRVMFSVDGYMCGYPSAFYFSEPFYESMGKERNPIGPGFIWGSVLANLIIGMACVIAVGWLCESLLRRREGRRPPASP